MSRFAALILLLVLSLSALAQSTSAFECNRHWTMQETDSSLVMTHEETVKAMVVIDWKARWIRIECASCANKVAVYDFVSHEVDEKAQIISFHFNSKELKVALLMVQMNGLAIQYKDGRIENYALSKQLW